MSAIPPTKQWIEFFKRYHELPALWKVMDDVYKNKRLKKQAYDKLLECYQRIDPEANVDSMRRKMNGIRTCYRRELRKVERSEKIAKSAKDIYVPHLWYFNELFFLRGNEIKIPKVAKNAIADNDTADEEDTVDDPLDDAMDCVEESDNYDDISEHETKVNFEQLIDQPAQLNETPPVVNEATPQLNATLNQSQLLPQLLQSMSHNTRDEAAVYAEGWALSYRKLDEKNKLLARKAIEEILVLGQLNKLELQSVRMS